MEPETGRPQVVTESSAPEVSSGTDPESPEANSSEVPDVEPSVPPLEVVRTPSQDVTWKLGSIPRKQCPKSLPIDSIHRFCEGEM